MSSWLQHIKELQPANGLKSSPFNENFSSEAYKIERLSPSSGKTINYT